MAASTVEDYRARPCFAHVINVNTDNYTAQVQLQPSGQTTPYLPILTQWAGDGWGLFSPPAIGAQVFVHFLEDDLSSGIISLCSFNNIDQAVNCPLGDFWLRHESGSCIKLHNDGSVEILGDAKVNIISPVITAGATETVEKLVKETFMALFNEHTHPVGGGATGAPNQQMTNDDLTTNFGAS